MLDQIEAAMSLWDRFKKWRQSSHEIDQELITVRFSRVFEAHGVHRNQIPRFFGHDLKLEDVQSDVSLLLKLDERHLEKVCELFSVRREWLDGADKQVHPTHSFYKHPSDFVSFIKNLQAANPNGELSGVVISPSDSGGKGAALLVLEERIGWVGQKPIFRYHLCDEWPFSYWKARAYLTACIAIAWKNAVYIRGIKASSKEIALLARGEILMGWEGEGFSAIGYRQWDPEDMALLPDKFLLGIDPERGNFGTRSGLKLWLQLHEDGFMDTGLSMYKQEEVRKLFQIELAKIQEKD
ncbi:hypothetical protein ABC383_17715 [Noviherbaspirillum sp. 1P10PC]|uniref:hypothetical protein n=1 Tax=Noviherbaspirillum sp. 1P10PC TaxID=3132292 RepID=UPI0039A102FC